MCDFFVKSYMLLTKLNLFETISWNPNLKNFDIFLDISNDSEFPLQIWAKIFPTLTQMIKVCQSYHQK